MHRISVLISPLSIFTSILFLVSVGDAIMSYATPVFIESHVQNTFIMGLVISFSSLVGILCDFLFAKWYSGKPYSFFLALALFISLVFPLTLLILPPWLTTFLIAMAAWGIYYELLQFSNFRFVRAHVLKNSYPSAWGFIETSKAAAYLVGPLIAGFLIDSQITNPFTGAIGFFIASSFGFIILTKFHRSHRQLENNPSPKQSFFHVAKVWATLWKKIWPLYLFLCALSLIDSSFWTVGALLMESLRSQNPLGNLILPAYTLSSLFAGILAGIAAKPMGKKRAAFLCGLITGIGLFVAGLAASIPTLLLAIFVSSFFSAIAYPEISATFEDYVLRLGKTSEDLVGLQSSAVSLSYIIGPIIAGFFASLVGNQRVFSLFGVTMFFVSLIALIIVPRKIRLPQTQINLISN